MSTSKNEKYYSPKDLAELFKISEATIRRLMREKKLRAFKVSDSWRVSSEDLQDWIEKGYDLEGGSDE